MSRLLRRGGRLERGPLRPGRVQPARDPYGSLRRRLHFVLPLRVILSHPGPMRPPPRHDPLQDHASPPPRAAMRSVVAGLPILEELGATPHAVVLFEAYRTVEQWTGVPREDRARLADPALERTWVAEVLAAGVSPAEEADLLLIGRIFRDPLGCDPLRIGLALRSLSHLAIERTAPQTAAYLAEAAAHCAPNDPGAAYQAGFTANRAGWTHEAEAWFRHGTIVARRQGDLTQAALFLSALGNVYYRRGALPTSERFHLRALGMARRARSRVRAAGALHDLALLAGERGDLSRAEQRARRAARLYGPNHPGLPLVLHDLAYIWMIHGQFETAYPLMEALLPHLDHPQNRVRTVGNLARAAAGAGWRDPFEQAWGEVVARYRAHEHDAAWAEALADALTETAHGALSIGEPGRARWAAERAEPLARSSQRAKQRMEIEALLNAAEHALTSPMPPTERAAPVTSPETVETAAHCMALIAARRVPA